MNEKLIHETKGKFKSLHGTEPMMVLSPGRINLIGEHTDYNDGFVFPAAIDKGIVLAIGKSDGPEVSLHALNMDETYSFEIKDLSPIPNGNWRNYILGVISELMKKGKNVAPFNAVFAGDIPSGAGMSSSAALENAFSFGLNELFQLGLTKAEMILVSQKAEHNFAGVKCGIMDQYASMFGIEDSAIFLDCRNLDSKVYKIDLNEYQLVLINSNVTHDLAESAYNDRRRVCEDVASALNVEALRDVDMDTLNSKKQQFEEEDYQKASYVIEENDRVEAFAKAIDTADIQKMGQLLFESHKGLSEKFKVSCEELDFLVSQAKQHASVVGSRMMGGGFGGCTISIVHHSGLKDFINTTTARFKEQFGKEASVYQVQLSDGTRSI